MSKPFYITTPLYYVNAKPHIGHAYTTVLCDAFARFERFMGERDVFFMTGTDEHGEKIAEAAAESGQENQAFVDGIVPHFKSLWQSLGISYDYFIRTTDMQHKEIVQTILRDLVKKGDIYKGEYKGWYCTPCESFWTQSQLVENKCPDCQRDVTEIIEHNYFFKLAKYQDFLLQYFKEHAGFVIPKSKSNEVVSFLQNPLEDLCITRPKARLSWGIPFPDDEEYVVYVWFDALINYISGVHYSKDEKKFKQLWPADVHMIGKDILRQHAVYWPIMLKAIGVDMPKVIVAHGWWTIQGAKMSKSRKNIVDPVELVKIYGVDPIRYYLLNEVILGNDGAYSEDLLIQKYNTDLANDLGNLMHRVFAMLKKYYQGEVPKHYVKKDAELPALMTSMIQEVSDALRQKMNPQDATGAIWKRVRRLNQFVEETKPWTLAKDEKQKPALANFMYTCLESLRMIGCLLYPFLPSTSDKMRALLKVADQPMNASSQIWGQLSEGVVLEPGEPLFPRLEVEESTDQA